MIRLLGTVVIGLIATGTLQAHFAFVVPEADGQSAKMIFSDTLAPDTKVNIEKLANTKLTLRDAAGKESPVEMKKGEGCYHLTVPGSGPRTIYGVTDYGVRQKGDDMPFRLMYYPKAVIGPIEGKSIGGGLRVEIMPVGSAGRLKFQVLADGKPLPEAEVTVLVPGSENKAVKTDKDGFTESFAPSGRYGVFARWTEPKGGELAGMKYSETRHYATLVVDVK